MRKRLRQALRASVCMKSKSFRKPSYSCVGGMNHNHYMVAKPPPGKSVGEVAPHLVAEWHPDNELTPFDVLPGSNVKVLWRCVKCHYVWATQVNSRAGRGSGCRKCYFARRGVAKATPQPGQSFGDLHPKVGAEWHYERNAPLKPTDVKSGSNRKVWWLCDEGHEWTVAPCDRLRGERCPECSKLRRALAQSTPKPGQSLSDLYPEIAAEWHPTKNAPLTAAEVNAGAEDEALVEVPYLWPRMEDRSRPPHPRKEGCPECGYERSAVVKSTPEPWGIAR